MQAVIMYPLPSPLEGATVDPETVSGNGGGQNGTGEGMSKQGIGRRQMLAGMGAGTLGAVAALGAGMTPVLAKDSEARVEGSWQAVIHIEKPAANAATFPAMLGFAGGGVFSRVDGRDNAPSLGTWKHSEAGIVFQRIEYQFSMGALLRTVNVLSAAKVDGDSMSGTFTGLVGGSFFRSGSFTASRVPAKGP
jgi:hypothetical protein